MPKNRLIIRFTSDVDKIDDKINQLKKIYNIKSDNWMIEHLCDIAIMINNDLKINK